MRRRNWLSAALAFSLIINIVGSIPVSAATNSRHTGIILQRESDFYNLMQKKTKKPKKRTNTISKVKAKANKKQILYLWDRGNVPAQTKYIQNDGGYFDDPSFVPYMTTMPAKSGKKVKGAVVLCAGGAFMFRGNYTDSIPVAKELNKQGYHCFIVDYRLDPYTQEEGALDVARAVRFIRKNAKVYKIDQKEHVE